MSRSEHELLNVLDTLYEGLLDEEAWQRALLATADYVSGSALALFSMNPGTGEVYRSDATRIDGEAMRIYHDHWIQNDPRHVAGLACPVGEPQIDGMLMNVREFHRTAVYNELLLPYDCPFHIATWIERKPTRGVVLSVQGTLKRGCFNDEERLRMRLLVPHLRRIIEMKDRLASTQVTASNLLASMDLLPFGMLLLGDSLRILEASATARRLLAHRDGVHADQGELGFVRHDDARAFARRLNENPASAALHDAVVIKRSGSRPPLSLLVLPLTPSQEHWLRPAARWMVLLFDPETVPSPRDDVLRRTLGLSPAEAALARLLADGLPLSRAAEQLGVSRHTVRSQLKSIYAKTGLRSQAQLVRRVMTSPAFIGDPSRQ